MVTELDSLRDMVSSGDSSRNEIADQAQVVIEAAGTAFRDSKELSAATRAEIDAADKAFRDAVKAIPSTTSSLEEAAQAYRAAYEAYDESIAAIRASARVLENHPRHRSRSRTGPGSPSGLNVVGAARTGLGRGLRGCAHLWTLGAGKEPECARTRHCGGDCASEGAPRGRREE